MNDSKPKLVRLYIDSGKNFYVEGKNVRVGVGRDTGTDILLQFTWELRLEGARTVYTPELGGEWKRILHSEHHIPIGNS